MGVIGNLAVNVTANTEKFSRGMKGARSEADLFAKSADSLKATVLGLGGALAAGFTAKFSFDAIRQTSEEMDRLSKESQTLKASIEGLGGLERSFKVMGAGGDLGQAMTFMERALEKNSDGFHRLHLDIDILKREKPEQVFLEVADALKEIEDNGKRLSIIRELFGKGGTGLAPMLFQGSDKIRAEMATQKGNSADDVRGMESLHDEGERLGQTFKQLESTLAVKFGPTVEEMIKRFNNAMGGSDPKGIERWTKDLDKLSDAQFAKFSGIYGGPNSTAHYDAVHSMMPWLSKGDQGMLGRGSKDFDAAIRLRDQRILDDINKRQAVYLDQAGRKPGMSGLPIGSAGPMGAMSMMGSELALSENAKLVRNATLQQSIAMRLAMTPSFMGQNTDEFAGQQDALNDLEKRRKNILHNGTDIHGGTAALEQGTAAAFSQGRHSQDASRALDVEKEQLKVLKDQLEAIKANKPKAMVVEIGDIS